LILPTNRTRGLRLTPKELSEALAMLRRHYGVRAVDFRVTGIRGWHVLTATVLDHPGVTPIVTSPVMRVWNGGLETADGQIHEGHVLVAAGYRSGELLPFHYRRKERHRVRVGTAFRYHGRTEPFMLAASKKRISIAFNETPDVIWAEDQSQLLEEKYGLENIVRTDLTLRRIVGSQALIVDYRTGHLLVRPVDGPWYARLDTHLTVATATERAGTLLAAHWASLFARGWTT